MGSNGALRAVTKGALRIRHASEQQGRFYDVDYLCDHLIPPESYYRQFRELVWPLLKDEDFTALYCQDNGRPPISPRL